MKGPKPLTWEDIISRTEKSGECLVYTGSRLPSGYGVIGKFGRNGTGGRFAHRVIFEQFYGPIPAGMFVCHTCDNPSCVNYEHLFLGTAGDNLRDMCSKGRHYATKNPERVSGEKNANSRLTEKQILEMRAMRQGGKSCIELERIFGISRKYVSRICNRGAWRCV
jgi:hypothetical protein